MPGFALLKLYKNATGRLSDRLNTTYIFTIIAVSTKKYALTIP